MALVHLIFGILLFVTFAVTGRFMRVDFPDKDAIDQGFRLLMRSRHIYILFSSLVHLVLGVYMHLHPRPMKRFLQMAGSIVLITASLLLVCAFMVETYQLGQFSNFSRFGIYLSLAGVGLHLLGGLDRHSGKA